MRAGILAMTAALAMTTSAARGGQPPGWELILEEGAEATLAVEGPAARVSKTNGRGLVHLRWSAPFPAEKDRAVVLRLLYHCEDATGANLLLLRATSTPDGVPVLDMGKDAFAVWTGQSLMRNSAPGEWATRLSTFQPSENGEITVHALLYGNPCTVRLGVPAVEPYSILPATTKPYGDPPYSEAEVRAILAERGAGSAKMGRHRGRPTIMVDGRPVLPIIYKGVNATGDYGDYAGFRRDGVDLATVAVATGQRPGWYQCDTEPVWLSRDEFDLDRVDSALLRALRRNPYANLILDIRIEPYKGWGKEHPDEIVRDAQGRRAYGPVQYVSTYTEDAAFVDAPDSGRFWYPSWQSEVWLADLERVFAKIAEHVATGPYGKAVVGFFITGNDDGQFVTHYIDHSEPTQRRFRRWLEDRYGGLDALNRAWGTAHTSFDGIRVPDGSHEPEATHLPPGPLADYYHFREASPWHVRERLAAVLKARAGKPVVAMVYAAPYHHTFVQCPSLDAVGMQPDYAHRRPGYPIAFYPVDGFDAGDKLLFTELDLRSVTGEWPSSEVFREWTGVPHSVEEWRHIHRKVAGLSLAHGYAYWYYDMVQYFNHPEIHAEIGAVRGVVQRLMDTPRSDFRPDVCVVVTERDRPHLTHSLGVIPYDEVNFNPQWQMLQTAGVPYERHYLTDIMARPELRRFKLYVFLQNAFLSDPERAFVRDTLRREGRTLLWVYNAGYIGEEGRSIDAMSEVIGMRLRTDGDTRSRRTLRLDVEGLKPFCGGAEMVFRVFNHGDPGLQSFWVDDPAADALGVYVETGQTAVARKSSAGCTSVYVGAAQGLSDEFLNRIATGAGAYVATAPGNQLDLNGEFASFHALKSGEVVLRLPPARTRAREAFSGAELPVTEGKHRFDAVVGRTYWFMFE